MRVLFHLCVFAVFAATFAQEGSNSTVTAPDAPFVPVQDGFAAVLGQISMQKQFSEKYGSIMMNIQAYQTWAQIAQQYMKMLELESASALTNILEESGEDLEEEASPIPRKESGYDDIERGTERLFLYVMKYYHLQAGQKLASVHQTHYENKIKIAMLSSSPLATNPNLQSALYLMYYQGVIRTLGASATLQRHDTLTQWLYYEILETDEFDNSRTPLPASFNKALIGMSLTHTGLHVQESTYALQDMYMDYYLKMIMGPMVSANNNAAASSFLEEEMTAEPNKPFFSPLMMMGTPYISYMTQYMNFAAANFALQAAQAFHYGAQISANPSLASEKNAVEIKKYALHAMFQWAYLNLQVNMYDMWGLFSGMPTAHHAAAANAFVQTGEATVTQA